MVKKQIPSILSIIAVFIATSCLQAQVARDLTDSNGRQLTASVLSVRGDQVEIKRASDSKVFVLPISQFCEKDQIYMRGLAEATNALQGQHSLTNTSKGAGDDGRATFPLTRPSATFSKVVGWVKAVPKPYDLTEIADVAVGQVHIIALKKDGTLLAWGSNVKGQCDVPENLKDVIKIAATGTVSMALTKDKQLHVWGRGSSIAGAEVVNTKLYHQASLEGIIDKPIKQIELGYCLTEDGNLYDFSQMLPEIFSRPSWHKSLDKNLQDVTSIYLSGSFGSALMKNGKVLEWGMVDGRGSSAKFSDLTYASPCGLAVDSKGGIVAWGIPCGGMYGYPKGEEFVQVEGGFKHYAALSKSGNVVVWGSGAVGPLALPKDLDGVEKIDIEYNQSAALMRDGTLITWGYSPDEHMHHAEELNDIVQLSIGRCLHSGMDYYVALQKNGEILTWGDDSYYLSSRSVPIDSVDTKNVVQVAASETHTLALKANGEVVAWGNNEQSACDVPQRLSKVIKVCAGTQRSLALSSDGTVTAWGIKEFVSQTNACNLKGIVDIASGDSHMLALKEDGTVCAWGKNNSNSCDVPAGLSNVVAITTGMTVSAALQSDGKVVVWGMNSENIQNRLSKLGKIKQVEAHHFGIAVLLEDDSIHDWCNGAYSVVRGPGEANQVSRIEVGYECVIMLMKSPNE